MRNPFRRQTETAAPTLRERAAALRENLSRQDAAPGERTDLYDRLLAAYAEDRAARPITGSDGDEIERRAANLVLNRTWALAREIVSMPPPATLDGLRATALASAILCEAESTTEDPTTVAAIGLTRAALAVTGTPLPPGFGGFGDEPDFKERDRALFNRPGSLPAWAIAEIEAEDAADDVQEAATDVLKDLPTAILDGWAAWGATTGLPIDASAEELAPWEQASAKRDHLLYAAMALPATPESIEAKALACAWMEWVNAEHPGQSRDDYGQADQLVYDIHATIMQRGGRDPNAVAPVPFTLSETALVPTVDFAGASMVELWDIFKAAELVCEIASTAAGNRHGRAGSLTRWVSNALCAVLTEAVDEARRRTPDNSDDRVARLAMICAATLDNEDPAEIQAFARELLTMVEQ